MKWHSDHSTYTPMTDDHARDKLHRFLDRIPVLQKAYERFLKVRGTPREIALGFALGLFVGMSPTLGFQMAIAVFLAALLKWNKITAATGVWISNPITAPVLYGATYWLGTRIAGMDNAFAFGDEKALSQLLQTLSKAPEIFWAMTLGGVVAGIPLALIGYGVAYVVVVKYQGNLKPKIAQKRETIARKRRARKASRAAKRKKRKSMGRR